MSVKFACQHCHQTLVAAEQKVGQATQCPRCAANLIVPDHEKAAALLEMKRLARETANRPSASAAASTIAAASPLAAASPTGASPPSALSPPSDPLSPAASGDSPLARARPATDPRRVSIARWVLFAQAALIALVAVAAFLSGYVIGGSSPVPETSPAPPAQPISITGSVRFRAGGGGLAPDSDAVIILLPKGAVVAEKIATAGLRPWDPAPAENNAQARILESLDGAYARADGSGEFRLSVRPGEYTALVISRHVRRPQAGPPPPDDRALIENFFSSAADLLGPSKYDLSERALPGSRPLDFEF